MRKKFETPSYSSPRGGRRGCLCKDGKTYSKKCCDGTLRAQGIGNITKTSNFNAYLLNIFNGTNSSQACIQLSAIDSDNFNIKLSQSFLDNVRNNQDFRTSESVVGEIFGNTDRFIIAFKTTVTSNGVTTTKLQKTTFVANDDYEVCCYTNCN